MTVKLTARPPEWVSCQNALRPVRDGRVACPVSGRAVDLESCATCHWLEDADQDRFASWTCDADDGSLIPIPIAAARPSRGGGVGAR